jgi:GT2 family glycosyltransferase
MKICSIVLNYRDAARTEACLYSLIGQGLHTVLVVDNSNDERAANELKEMLARQSVLVDYALHLLNPGMNLGFARGINFALNDDAARECDAFLLINNDAVALPGMVEHLAVALTDTNSLMAAPKIVNAAGKTIPMFWYQRYFGLLTTRQLPGSFPYLSGCCLLVRREVLSGGKLLDEDFFMYGEDTLLGWRLAQAGKMPLLLEDAVARHDGTGSSQRGQMFYEYHMARAHILLATKTWRYSLEIPFMLISKTGVLGMRALWRSLYFRSVVPLKAFFRAWRALNVRVP